MREIKRIIYVLSYLSTGIIIWLLALVAAIWVIPYVNWGWSLNLEEIGTAVLIILHFVFAFFPARIGRVLLAIIWAAGLVGGVFYTLFSTMTNLPVEGVNLGFIGLVLLLISPIMLIIIFFPLLFYEETIYIERAPAQQEEEDLPHDVSTIPPEVAAGPATAPTRATARRRR